MRDLAAFRAYGALFADDREGGLNAIRAEARRMQERVTFEKEIRLAMDREQKEAEERDPDDPEEDVDDPDEWWRLLQDGGEQERYVPESILAQNYTPLQANRLMHAFMPTTGQPEELGHLLSCKADPNSPPTLAMSPLYKVNVFALDADVDRMREILFMYGATESLEEKQRMAERPTTSDATRKLHAFRPIAESVATLKSLLEEKADPNGMKPLPPGHIIPLQNVYLNS